MLENALRGLEYILKNILEYDEHTTKFIGKPAKRTQIYSSTQIHWSTNSTENHVIQRKESYIVLIVLEYNIEVTSMKGNMGAIAFATYTTSFVALKQ